MGWFSFLFSWCRHASVSVCRFPFCVLPVCVRLCLSSVSACAWRLCGCRWVRFCCPCWCVCFAVGRCSAGCVPWLCGSVRRWSVVGVRAGAARVCACRCSVWLSACGCRFSGCCALCGLFARCLVVLALPVFPSVSLARGWAVACGVPLAALPGVVSGVPGAWSSVPGPPARPSCLFCRSLGRCGSLSPRWGCGFSPFASWPGSGSFVPARLF